MIFCINRTINEFDEEKNVDLKPNEKQMISRLSTTVLTYLFPPLENNQSLLQLLALIIALETLKKLGHDFI